MRARDNPFRSERLHSLKYRLEGSCWAELLARCERLRYRGALVGPYGVGKTTLLEALGGRLAQQGRTPIFFRVPNSSDRFGLWLRTVLEERLTERQVILLDGTERLNGAGWCWLRWRTRRAGLIVTTHHPVRLPTLWECRTSPSLLAELAAELLRCEPDKLLRLAGFLYQKHDGNLREALRECYDLHAALPDHVTPDVLGIFTDRLGSDVIVRT